MDVATVTMMNGVLATRQQWMDRWWHNGDERLEDNATAMQRRWSNATAMDVAMMMDVATSNGDGHLVGW